MWFCAGGAVSHNVIGGTDNGGKCRMAVDGGARMGALRRAGVWLGLVEDEDERGYDDRHYRSYGDDFADDDDEVDEVPAPRARTVSERLTAAERLEASTASRTSTVRSITRPTSTVSYPTRDNLALAPQPTVRERQPVEEESDDRRYAITTLHPTTYNEARTIGEHFRDGVPVIMNLTEMDEADAKRLVDFAAGLVFGLRGNFERVTNRVFLLSPANVQVTAEDKAKIAEGGFFNQS
ncbi:cell division protein SepF 2 [Dactylosporangium sucinum]|uniref:Cell division protein SepF n=2 Tax=Dactylosporangium sucinum TaxID=1424081 RepID=A0A917X863_9ACTN|nr:cell division protein SepF 2 [Dactylosporangium sucinum]